MTEYKQYTICTECEGTDKCLLLNGAILFTMRIDVWYKAYGNPDCVVDEQTITIKEANDIIQAI